MGDPATCKDDSKLYEADICEAECKTCVLEGVEYEPHCTMPGNPCEYCVCGLNGTMECKPNKDFNGTTDCGPCPVVSKLSVKISNTFISKIVLNIFISFVSSNNYINSFKRV